MNQRIFLYFHEHAINKNFICKFEYAIMIYKANIYNFSGLKIPSKYKSAATRSIHIWILPIKYYQNPLNFAFRWEIKFDHKLTLHMLLIQRLSSDPSNANEKLSFRNNLQTTIVTLWTFFIVFNKYRLVTLINVSNDSWNLYYGI